MCLVPVDHGNQNLRTKRLRSAESRTGTRRGGFKLGNGGSVDETI